MGKPNIRFKEYTEDWEQRKFGEVITEVSRPIKMEDDKEYQLVTVKRRNEGLISRGYFYGRDILVKNYYEVHAGDYVISKRQLVHGANGQVPEKLDKSIVSNEYMVCADNSKMTTTFLTVLSKTKKLKKDFFLSSYGIDIEKLVFNVEDWKKRSVLLPSIKEQNRISKYFYNLDNIITLHQQKCDETKKLKKCMLQKMFPKEGEKVPEIRFSGFTGDWKQRKLGDVAEIIGGGTPKTSINDYWDGEINWYAPAEIGNLIYVSSSQRKITKLGLNKSSAKILPVGTVLFTSRAGIGKTAILACEGCTNQGFQSIVPRKGMLDSYFIFVRTEELKRYAETVGAGSTFVEVSGKQMMDMELMLPITIEEQQKIGNYFAEIDSLITFHQQRYDELKNIKKFMLQNMFVSEK